MMTYHICAFVAGFILDLIFGDPHNFFHPVIAIGKLISVCDGKLRNGKPESDKRNGYFTVIIVLTVTFLVSAFALGLGYALNPFLGCFVEAFMTYQALAAKSLRTESMKVYKALFGGSIDEARQAVSMIVGRDTKELDKEHIIAAAVETVAENASDGVIAPMIYLALGGPLLGYLYKAVNTMDSMIGYKNEKYMNFGKAAAKLDDVLNFIPSRISGLLFVLAAGILGKDYSAKEALRIFKRDRRNHKSPNSAQTEAACAGALGIRLAGDASYFGQIVKKPFIGDKKREIETEDIKRANTLMYCASTICFLICTIVMVMFMR